MKRTVLIDAVVRQMMELVAEIAVAEGKRAPLSDITSNAYLDLCRALSAKGLSSKVIADMFGITVRAHNQKKKRLADGIRQTQKTLWQRIAAALQQHRSLSKKDLLATYPSVESDIISGILYDLVESGLATREGKGLLAIYSWQHGEADPKKDAAEHLTSFIWVVIHRLGPISRSSLATALPSVSLGDIEKTIDRLCLEERIQVETTDIEPIYSSHQCILAKGEASGWEAPAYDHFQAVMTVLKNRLNRDIIPKPLQLYTGGSTYYFDVDDTHPLLDDVLGLLERIRRDVSALRKAVDARNIEQQVNMASTDADNAPATKSNELRSVFYLGQSVEPRDDKT